MEGSAEERCLVLAVNWPALVAGGLTGAAAAAAASAVAVVGMPAAYSLMAARRQKEKIRTHYFQPWSRGLPGFSGVLHKQPNPSFSLACSQYSSQSWSLVLGGHTAYNQDRKPLIYPSSRTKGGWRKRRESEAAWHSTENAESHCQMSLSTKPVCIWMVHKENLISQPHPPILNICGLSCYKWQKGDLQTWAW